ncbi:MAG: OmpH family outer membrane protein [Synergistetes bacterium]|nr:OmpH family outer membrane protein [Synergistota bacterium]MDW8193121.1 OmpH family outer membrane protein [Synergistota bacterium]
MKRLVLALSLTAIMVLSFTFAQGAWAQSPVKIGVVDVDYLLNNHPKAEEVRAQIKSFVQKQESQVKTEIENLRKNIKDEKELRQKESEVFRKAQAEFDKYKNELLNPLMKDVDTAIREVAKKQGIEIVLLKGAVFFGGIDLTQDAFNVLKSKYGKAK